MAALSEKDKERLQSVNDYLARCVLPKPRETKHRPPDYKPKSWNHFPVLQNANCYAYAANNMDLVFPRPGCRGIYPMGRTLIVEFNKAASDGFIPAPVRPGQTKPTPVKGYYLTALFVTHAEMGIGMHWYRQDSDGSWSHKDGNRKVTNKDDAGHRIRDPRKAIQNPDICYFTSFFYAPNEGVALGSKRLKPQ